MRKFYHPSVPFNDFVNNRQTSHKRKVKFCNQFIIFMDNNLGWTIINNKIYKTLTKLYIYTKKILRGDPNHYKKAGK